MKRTMQRAVIACLLGFFGAPWDDSTGVLKAAESSADALLSGGRGAGSLKFEAMVHDFGAVHRGDQLSYQFKFVNAGKGPLSIQGVHATCGCTAAQVDKSKVYEPGESGVVDVKLDTTNFVGKLVKTVTVLSNEKLLPDRTLTLKADIRSEIEAEPPLADFGDTPMGQPATKTVRIKRIGDAKFEVKDVVFNAQVLDVKWVKVGDEGYDVSISLKEGLQPGFVKENILVRNSSAHLRELPVPVRATVKGKIDYAPNYVEFGAIAPDDSAKRSVVMKGNESFGITGSRAELIINGRRIDDASTLLKVEALPHEKDRQLVSLELKNAAKVAGSVHGKVFFSTSDPSQKELAVDFYAFFR